MNENCRRDQRTAFQLLFKLPCRGWRSKGYSGRSDDDREGPPNSALSSTAREDRDGSSITMETVVFRSKTFASIPQPQTPMWSWLVAKPTHCYLFAHVAKCGGTTLVHTLGRVGKGAICLGDAIETRSAVREEAKRLIQARRLRPDQVRLFFGHRVHYGLHELSSLPPRYFTFVRHPHSRVISLYNHHCGIADTPGHPHQQRDLAIVGSREHRIDFLTWLMRHYSGNHMVRFLSAAMQGESTAPAGAMTENDLQLAQQFLDHCWFVGLTEQSEVDVQRVCRAIGIRPPAERSNVSTIYQDQTNSPNFLAAIDDVDALDVRLYKYAIERRNAILKTMDQPTQV